MKKKNLLKKILISSSLITTILFLTSCSNTATTIKLVKTDGDVTVNDDENESIETKENMFLYNGYNMKTNENSYAWINLDSERIAKADENSEISFEKKNKKTKIDILRGNMFFDIERHLDKDETLSIHTSTMAVGIRGTSGWIVSNGNEQVVALLNGEVEVIFDINGKNESSTIKTMQELRINDSGYEVKEIEEIPDFVKDEINKENISSNDILKLMEEVDVSNDLLSLNTYRIEKIISKNSIKILAPIRSYDNFNGKPIDKEYEWLNIKTIGTYVNAYDIKEPDKNPELVNGYSVWVETSTDVLDATHKKIIIFSPNYSLNMYNESPGLEIEFVFKHENEDKDNNAIDEVFDSIYDMITRQL